MARIQTLSGDTQLHVGAMLPLILVIGGNISTAKEHRIYYFLPGNKTEVPDGYWSATIQDAANGYIKYDTAVTDLSEKGLWKFAGWETDASDNINFGKAVKVMVYNVGEIPPK